MGNNNHYYSCIEAITPDIAKKYLAKNTSNRLVRKDTVAYYADQMKRGQWKMNGESICFTADGKLADGQHRLLAIIESGVTILATVVRGCDEGSFATYDSGLGRRVSDAFYLAGIADSKKRSCSVTRYLQIKNNARFVRASAGNGTCSKRLKISRQDLIDMYFANKNLFDDVARVAARCAGRLRILTETEIAGVAAYLIKDMMWPANTVYEFFEELTTLGGTGHHIVGALRDIFVKDKMSKEAKMPNQKKQNLLIKAWNKYSSGSAEKRLRYNEEADGKIWFAKNDKIM